MNSEFPYWTDPERDEFSVTISACTKSDKHFEIVIDQEVVRAAGGGQAGDKGLIQFGNEIEKFHDAARIDGNLVLLTNSPIEPNTDATVKIDMKWRKAMMRNHTGEHLFVAAIKREHPEINLDYIWIDGDRGTVDLKGKELGIEHLMEAELSVQNVIEKGTRVKTTIVKASEVSSEVRAREGLSDKHDFMRIVEVGNYDRSACSGIHVTNTRDIEFFKVVDFKAKDSGSRVTFVAGDEAKKIISATYNEVLRYRHSYPFEMEQIGEVLDKAKSAADERKLIVEKIVQLLADGVTSEDVGGITFIHEYIPGLDSKAIKTIIKKIKLSGPAALLLFIPGERSTLTLSTNQLPVDASEYIARIIEEMGGRGGGSRDVYTGGFSDTKVPEEAYSKIVDRLRTRLREEGTHTTE
jgi:alanyl-tRNA synthetase